MGGFVRVDFWESPEKIKKFAEYISAYYDEYDGQTLRLKMQILML